MKELTLRKAHGYLGITLAVFLLLQGGSGLLLSAAELLGPVTTSIFLDAHGHAKEPRERPPEPETAENDAELQVDRHDDRHGLLAKLHHPQGTLWNLYRIAVGTGLLVMLGSGSMIFLKTKARTKKKPPQ